ncbi:hypothetical protein [Lactobacillus intestinalis]|uniref:hypothetical protein n=1 Tax=Lactobacillus intestinalis TaxID=151781 RepID=UPI00272B12C3|nr:hypothetical protein [Lactobacillus intestinalis]
MKYLGGLLIVALTIIFACAKLFAGASIPWLFVFMPLVVYVAIWIGLLLLIGFCAVIMALIDKYGN